MLENILVFFKLVVSVMEVSVNIYKGKLYFVLVYIFVLLEKLDR